LSEVLSGAERLPNGSQLPHTRNKMKKWLLIALALVMLSGCAMNKVWKWIDDMDYERDDQTVRIVDIFIK
jgi:uncharacterized lipoprotein YajG